MEIAKLKSAIEAEIQECRVVKNNTRHTAIEFYLQAHTELQAYSRVLEIIHELEVEEIKNEKL